MGYGETFESSLSHSGQKSLGHACEDAGVRPLAGTMLLQSKPH